MLAGTDRLSGLENQSVAVCAGPAVAETVHDQGPDRREIASLGLRQRDEGTFRPYGPWSADIQRIDGAGSRSDPQTSLIVFGQVIDRSFR